MAPEELLDAFAAAAGEVGRAVGAISGPRRRARTRRAGQYEIDLAADAAALRVLHGLPVGIVSEESGRSGAVGAEVVVVVDPVDGSTNAAREIPYWATSICALDADGPLAALVVNQATGVTYTAVRGSGARRDGTELRASDVARVDDAVVALSSLPDRILPWKQFRSLGSCALALCDVAAGSIDAYVDAGRWHAPWDYLGGWLACREAGATVVDVAEEPLAVTDPQARRQLLAAATPALLGALRRAVVR